MERIGAFVACQCEKVHLLRRYMVGNLSVNDDEVLARRIVGHHKLLERDFLTVVDAANVPSKFLEVTLLEEPCESLRFDLEQLVGGVCAVWMAEGFKSCQSRVELKWLGYRVPRPVNEELVVYLHYVLASSSWQVHFREGISLVVDVEVILSELQSDFALRAVYVSYDGL